MGGRGQTDLPHSDGANLLTPALMHASMRVFWDRLLSCESEMGWMKLRTVSILRVRSQVASLSVEEQ